MMKWKAFVPDAWSALLSSILRVKKAADDNASAVSGLEADFVQLTQTTTATLQDMSKDITELQSAVEQLRKGLADGTVTAAPAFPVLSADPANPKEGEAWIKT